MKLKAKYDIYELPAMSALVEVLVEIQDPDSRRPARKYPLVRTNGFQMRSTIKQEAELGVKRGDPVYFCPDNEENPKTITIRPIPDRDGKMIVRYFPPMKEA